MELKLSNIIENRNIISRKLENIFTDVATDLSSKLNQVNNIISYNQYDEQLLKSIIDLCLDNFNKVSELFDYSVIENEQIGIIITNKQLIFDSLFSKLKLYWLSNITFEYSVEKLYDKHNEVNGAIYKVNGIECCKVRKYMEYFCSIDKYGRPSNIRNKVKTAKQTSWDRANIRKIIGKWPDREILRDSYPDTNYGYPGSMISFKQFKDLFESFLNS